MDTIKIGPIEFDIEIVDNLHSPDGKDKLDGIIMYKGTTIQIDGDANAQASRQILWHEIIHGILTQAGIQIKNEENICEVLSHGIMSVLQNNGWLHDD